LVKSPIRKAIPTMSAIMSNRILFFKRVPRFEMEQVFSDWNDDKLREVVELSTTFDRVYAGMYGEMKKEGEFKTVKILWHFKAWIDCSPKMILTLSGIDEDEINELISLIDAS
jgi:hypothetical protein